MGSPEGVLTATPKLMQPAPHRRSLQSQSFFQSYGSILPTSLTLIVSRPQRLLT